MARRAFIFLCYIKHHIHNEEQKKSEVNLNQPTLEVPCGKREQKPVYYGHRWGNVVNVPLKPNSFSLVIY